MLGQEQDSFGGDFSSAESFKGKLSQFNLWNKSFNKSCILHFMQGCNKEDDDIAPTNDNNQHQQQLINSNNRFAPIQKELSQNLVISWADFRRTNTLNGFLKVPFAAFLFKFLKVN